MCIITPVEFGLVIHVFDFLYKITTQNMLDIITFDIWNVSPVEIEAH